MFDLESHPVRLNPWISLLKRHLGRWKRSNRAGQRRATRPTSPQSQVVERLEERTLLVPPQLVAVLPNVGSFIVDNEVRTEAPRELTLRFSPGQTINANTLSGIVITRAGFDAGDFEESSVYTDFNTTGASQVVVSFEAQRLGAGGDGIAITITKSDLGLGAPPTVTANVAAKTINVVLNSNSATPTLAQGLVDAINNNATANQLVQTSVRGNVNGNTNIATPAAASTTLTTSGANSASAVTTFTPATGAPAEVLFRSVTSGPAGNGITIVFNKADLGGLNGNKPLVVLNTPPTTPTNPVTPRTITVTLNNNATVANHTTAQALVDEINAIAGTVVRASIPVGSPAVDLAILPTINPLVLGGANDVTLTPGSVSVSDTNSNEVIYRFADTLPNDRYRLEVYGTGPGTILRNTVGAPGEAFNSGVDARRSFVLDLGAKVTAVVPQPVLRDKVLTVVDFSGTTPATPNHMTDGDRILLTVGGMNIVLEMEDTTIANGVLAGNIAVNFTPAQSAATVAGNIATAIDGLTDPVFDAGATAAANLITVRGNAFEPSARSVTSLSNVLTVADGGLTRRGNIINVFFNEDVLSTLGGVGGANSVLNPAFYQLFFTQDTVQNTDDVRFTPGSVTYDAATNSAKLFFTVDGTPGGAPTDINALPLAGPGTFRLRIGTNEVVHNVVPTAFTPGADPGSSFATANNIDTVAGFLGFGLDGTSRAKSITISSVVQNSTSGDPAYSLVFPGTGTQNGASSNVAEPGDRDIPAEYHNSQDLGAPAGLTDGDTQIDTQFYNFQSNIGTFLGNPLFNQITEAQKQRAREIYELYGRYLGIKFVETANLGTTIATGDLRAADPTLPDDTGILGLGSNAKVVLNHLFTWDSQYGAFGNNGWFGVAMHEIGHSIGRGHSYEFDEAVQNGPGALSQWPGPYDIVNGQAMYRPDSKDIDLYRFTIAAGTRGVFTAETIAERQFDSSMLDTYLRLFRELPQIEVPASGGAALTDGQTFILNDGVNPPVTFEFNSAGGVAGTNVAVAFTATDSQATLASSIAAAINAVGGTLNTVATVSGSRVVMTSVVSVNLAGTPALQNVREQIAANDDYYSEDSYLELELVQGTYYIGVTASGNSAYDPTIPDSGLGGKTEGSYNLRMNFRPTSGPLVASEIKDAKSTTILTGGGGPATSSATLANPLFFRVGDVLTISGASGSPTIATINYSTGVITWTTGAITFANNATVTATGQSLDGDNDGQPGGAYSFWFTAQSTTGAAATNNTLYVDSRARTTATAAAGDGTITNPFNTISGALTAAAARFASLPAGSAPVVVRIVGNGGADNDIATLNDNVAYLIGQDQATFANLQDGSTLSVPRGVTVMVDAGAIFKVRNAIINVGSASSSVDQSRSALQVLGTTARSVYFTSYEDANIGRDDNTATNPATPGQWGGIVFRSDNDRASGRFDYENRGGFLNYVNHATILYGGGSVTNDSTAPQPRVSPIHLIDSRPTVTFNTFQFNGDAAISADPNSFRETNFHSPPFQISASFTADYTRVGPEVRGNSLGKAATQATNAGTNSTALTVVSTVGFLPGHFITVGGGTSVQIASIVSATSITLGAARTWLAGDTAVNDSSLNSVNGMAVRSDTVPVTQPGSPGGQTKQLTVTGRFDDTDIVHVVSENLIVTGTPSGAFREQTTAERPPVSLVTLTPVAGSTLPLGTYNYRVVFVDADGNEGLPSNPTSNVTTTTAGTQSVSLTNLPTASGIYLSRRLYRGTGPGPSATYTLVSELDATTTTFTDTGVTAGGLLLTPATTTRDRPRLNGGLTIDPQVVVKLNGSRIELGMGSRLSAEATDGQPVIFTSAADDRYGAGGTFDTNSASSAVAAGQWSGIYAGQNSRLEIDYARISFAGGTSKVQGGFSGFNTIEIHQADARIAHSLFESNGTGVGGAGTIGGLRVGHETNQSATIYVQYSQPTIIGNTFRDRAGDPNTGAPMLNFDVNSLNQDLVSDPGRGTYRGLVGPIDPNDAADRYRKYGALTAYRDNRGPLVRDNLFDARGLNGLAVRGGTVTVQSVWDDADVPHIVRSTIDIDNTYVYGGVRLQSAPNQSLVVKLNTVTVTTPARFQVNGTPLDITDRIGGILQIVGQPGFPVVLTSLADDTIGAGFDPTLLPQTDTNGDGAATTPAAGNWDSILIDEFAHDRNVTIQVERELATSTAPGTNSIPATAEYLGKLAQNESSGDENSRMGFEVHGFLHARTDVDVYSFDARVGTEVWIDIDNTSMALDTVVELIDASGNIIAQSDDSIRERTVTTTTTGTGAASTALAVTSSAAFRVGDTIRIGNAGTQTTVAGIPDGVTLTLSAAQSWSTGDVVRLTPFTNSSPAVILPNQVNILRKDPTNINDSFTLNPRDAGMRVVLPGPAGATTTFHVRVRSSPRSLITDPQTLVTTTAPPAVPSNGQTTGVYQLQIRLRETQEYAGTTVQYSDIRYATDGLRILGHPAHSLLAGEAAEPVTGYTFSPDQYTEVANDTRANAQAVVSLQLGNMLSSDRGAISVAGTISDAGSASDRTDVDFFQFSVSYDDIQDPASGFISTVFDIDYSDGLARGDLTLGVFDNTGRLIYIGRDSNIADDRPRPLNSNDLTDLSRGSVGPHDASIGPVELPFGTYFVAVSSNSRLPDALDQFQNSAAAANVRQVRLEPVTSVSRIAEDRIGSTGGSNIGGGAAPPRLLFNTSEVPYHLGDVNLFVSTGNVSTAGGSSALQMFNPFTGRLLTTLGANSGSFLIGDIAMRPRQSNTGGTYDTDYGSLFAFSTGAPPGTFSDALRGNYLRLDTGTGQATNLGDDGIQTFGDDPTQAGLNVNATNIGLGFNAMAYDGYATNVNNRPFLYAIGNRNPTGNGNVPSVYVGAYATPNNILYQFNAETGASISQGALRANDPRATEGAGTDVREIGQVLTLTSLTPGGTIEVGDQFTVTLTVPATALTQSITFTATAATPANVIAGLQATWAASALSLFTAFTPATTTTTLTAALNSAFGANVVITTSTTNGGADNTQSLTSDGRFGPGGNITGMTFVGGTLYAVSDTGGLWTVNTANAASTYVRTSAAAFLPPTNAAALNFQGLATGPAMTGGPVSYANTLFAITQGGTVFAFNTTGQLQPIFVNGQTSIATGVTGAIGLAFSTLDRNLWNITDTRRGNQGHGLLVVPPDQTVDPDPDAGNSYYFGDDAPTNRPAGAPVAGTSTYNFPGGAHGSLVSNTFSLKGYSTADQPYLYFNYFLATENTDFSATQNMRDSLRVFVANDSGNWRLVATNDSYRASAGPADEYNAFNLTGYPATSSIPTVQELYDSSGTWRQARVPLAPFAGQENLRIRFDFATAGEMNVGDATLATRNTTGSELRAIDGDLMRDGDTVTIDTTVFEIDMGYSLVVPSGDQIPLPSTLTVNGTTFTFVKAAPAPTEIQALDTDSAETIAAAITARLATIGITAVSAPVGTTRSFRRDRLNLIGATTITTTGALPTTFVEGAPLAFNRPATTTATNAGAASTALTVENTAHFRRGDTITIGATVPVLIASVNSPTSITLAAARTWAMSDPVTTNTTATNAGAASTALSVVTTANFRAGDSIRIGAGAPVIILTVDTLTSVTLAAPRTWAITDVVSGANVAISANAQQPRTTIAPNIRQILYDNFVSNRVATTTATNAGTASTTLAVVSTANFRVGDTITIGATAPVVIASVNSTTSISLAAARTWAITDQVTSNTRTTNAGTGSTALTVETTANLVAGDSITIGGGTAVTIASVNSATSITLATPSTWAVTATVTRSNPSQNTTVALDRDLIRIIGHQVNGRTSIGAGGQLIGYENSLDGDTYGAFFDSASAFAGSLRGMDNAHEGVYIDDIIIGFAERGEMVVEAPPDTSGYRQNVDLLRASWATPHNQNLRGPYQLEIRRGPEFAQFDGAASQAQTPTTTPPNVALSVAYDTNDRLGHFVTLTAPRGSQIGDGASFVISDGVNTLTFEYEDLNVANGVTPGRVSVGYRPADPDSTVAAAIRDAINSTAAQNVFRGSIQAGLSDGRFTGTASTSSRVNLYGNALLNSNAVPLAAITPSATQHVISAVSTFTDFFGAQIRYGDENRRREQGQILVVGNTIRDSQAFGIVIDAGSRTGAAPPAGQGSPHPGSVRSLPELDLERLVPGVVVMNNVIARGGTGGIHYSGDPNTVGVEIGPVPFGRIVNNTIFGNSVAAGIGIQIDDHSAPTLLNNIFANLQTGVTVVNNAALFGSIDPNTVVQGDNYFQNNTNDLGGALAPANYGAFAFSDKPAVVGAGGFQIPAGSPLFVDPLTSNFYLRALSPAIDSGLSSLDDRFDYANRVKSIIGISPSPILAPDRDLFGLKRFDDPSVNTPAGIGGNSFIDHGALERTDFAGPNANPIVLDDQGNERPFDTTATVRQIDDIQFLRQFIVQLTDQGTGISDATTDNDGNVTNGSPRVQLFQNGVLLTAGVEYVYAYNSNTNRMILTSASTFPLDTRYQIVVDPVGAKGITDLAGNQFLGNQADLSSQFNFIVTNGRNDAPVNTVPTQQAVIEDGTLTFSTTNNNVISVNDQDAALNVADPSIQVTLTVSNGTGTTTDDGVLTLSTTAGLSFTFTADANGAPAGDGTADRTMTFRGSISAINTALNGMRFLPAQDRNDTNNAGTTLLTITTNDLGKYGPQPTPLSTVLSTPNSVTITILPVNDEPTLNDPPDIPSSGGIVENDGVIRTVNLSGIAAGRSTAVDELAPSQTLSISLSSSPAGFFTGPGGVLQINPAYASPSATATLEFRAATNEFGTGTITVTVTDNGGTANGGDNSFSQSFTVFVAPASGGIDNNGINDPPVNTLPAAYSTNEDISRVLSGISVTDPDAGTKNLILSFSVTSGTLTVNTGVASGVTAGQVTGNNSATVTLTASQSAINATLANATGLMFVPTPNQHGPVTLTMSTNDQGFTGTGSALTDTDTSTITVNSVNDQPLAVADTSYATAEDTPLVVPASTGVLANDSDPNDTPPTGTGPANTLSAVLVTPPNSGGSVTLNPNGSFVYIPGSNFVGNDTFTYRVEDNGGGVDGGDANGNDPIGNTVSVTIQIGGANDPPINNIPAAQFVNEDTPLTFNVTNANRIFVDDPDASTGTMQFMLSATNGSLTLSTVSGLTFSGGGGDGTSDASMTFTATITAANSALNGMTFTPLANFNGNASLTITSNDLGNTGTGGAKSDTDTLAITVRSANDPPIAVADGYVTNEDTVLNVSAASGVLFNDSDPNDSPANNLLAILQGAVVTVNPDGSRTTATTSGVVTLRTDGSFTYTPSLNFNGTDSFSYRVTDTGGTANGGTDQGNVVTATITINAINDAPVNSLPATASVIEDASLVFSVANGNAISVTDVDAGTGQLRVDLTATDGTLTLATTNGLSFTGGAGDGMADASMRFTGTRTDINAALNGLLFAPTANFNSTGSGRSATVNITTNDLGNSGLGNAAEDADTVFVTVVSVNDPPVAQPDFYSTAEDTTLSVPAGTGVLFNDSDPVDTPANVLSGVLVTTTSSGNLTFNSNGSFTYTPVANFRGIDSFTYRVQDNGGVANGGINVGNTVTVSIDVGGVNDPPINSVPGTQNMLEEGTLVFSSANGNAISVADPDAGTSNVRVTLTAVNGTVSLSGTGGLSFTPPGDGTSDATVTFTGPLNTVNSALAGSSFRPTTNFTGQASLSITIDDLGNTGLGGAKTDTDLILINVNDVNDPPVAQPDTYSVNEDTTLTVSAASGVLANDSDTADSPADSLSAILVTGTSSGTLSLNSNGSFTYIPTANFNGTDTFTYRVVDDGGTANGGNNVGNTVTATITVNAVNDAPVNTVPAAQNILEDTARIFNTTNANVLSVADLDAGANPLRVTLAATNGTVTLSTISGLSFNPGAGDGTGDATMTFTGTATAVNAALNGLAFLPVANFVGTATLAITTNDQGSTGSGGALSDSDTFNLNVAAVNDPPLTVANTYSTNEDTGLSVNVAQGVLANDADVNDVPANAISAVLQGAGVVTNSDSSRTVATSANGSVTLFPDGHFVYTPAANFNGTDSFQYRAEDNGGTSNGGNNVGNTVTVNLTVVAVNDAPVNTLPGIAQTTSEETSKVFGTVTGNQISIADVDAAASPIRTTISVMNGTVTLATISGLTFSTGDGLSDPTMIVTGTATAINTALNGMSFTPTANFNGTATMMITTDDQGNTGLGGALFDTDSLSISVSAVNDAPVNSVPGTQITNDEDPVTFSSARGNAITLNDIDAGAGSIQLTLFPVAGTVQMATLNGVTVTSGIGAAGEAYVLTGTLANLNTALNGLQFRPVSDFNGAASLIVTTNDSGNTGSGGPLSDSDTINITVNDVNDAPVNNVPSVQTLSEDGSKVFSGNIVSITDVDARTGTLRVVLTAANGTLTLGSTNNLTFAAGDGVQDSSMSFTGTLTNLNAALNGLTFTPNLNFNGSASFTMTTDDQGNSGVSGGALSDTDTVFLTVTPVNDAPTLGTQVTLRTALSGQTFTISYATLLAELAGTDLDGDTVQLRVDQVFNGILTKNGVTVTLGVTTIGPNESLVWTPPSNVNATLRAFALRAVDASAATSADPVATVSIDVATITRYLRAYNPRTDYHFFTMSQSEFDNSVRALGYRDETTGRAGFAVATGPAPLTHAIHRLYNPNNNRHYYTANTTEKEFLVSIGYRYEKDEGFIFTTQIPGSTTVFRLYNNNSGTHLLTESASQMNAILAQFPGIWVRHADFGFAFPVSASGLPPVIAVARRAPAAETSSAGSTSANSLAAFGNKESSVTNSGIERGLIESSSPRHASAINAPRINAQPSPLVRNWEARSVGRMEDACNLDRFWQQVGRQLEQGVDLSDELNAVLVGQ